MVKALVLLAMLLASVMVQASGRCQHFTASGNAEYPPYLWRSAQDPMVLVGANAMLMDYIAEQLGVSIDIGYVGPWGRTQEELAKGHIDFIAGAFFTEPRTKRMDYLYPAFQLTRTAVWVSEFRPFNYSQWQDLVGRQGVTVINNSFGQAFDEYAAENLTIHEAVKLEQGLRMLQGDRVDYFIYELNPGRAYASQLGISDVRPLAVPVSQEPLYLTMSKQSVCNTPEFRQRIEQVLQKAEQEKVMEGFLQQAISDWRESASTDLD
ncbi:amino acid ABC transporter substrate-binding protein [Bacterioplanes sanyensis]|uniref:Amino acid ABC transporter substrate-binding protein n=1 Tax=Bacterioplanes sanyensis TaxID=1249553 RepID=A0A222FI27_9GAMM|nr:transporter substrate-binding domain-containing protein [Bacterioplanes sanyensis]ASP38134.1 amino acid ABC transporter substrate-binding protein [Bacterioplanes sanyensis]